MNDTSGTSGCCNKLDMERENESGDAGNINKSEPTETVKPVNDALTNGSVSPVRQGEITPDTKQYNSVDQNKTETDLNAHGDASQLNDVLSDNEEDDKDEDDYDDDDLDDDDDDDGESGDESDIEDNEDFEYPVRIRDPNPQLPETVTTLETSWGSKVYLVGTAHFSLESQEDVSKTIQATQPDVVMVELCNSRVNILQLDEETLLEEAKNINLEKIRLSIKQSGIVQGIMHLLLLSMSAHFTKELGMAPGGEFRRAFREAQKIPACKLHLGDRPIQITLKRALGRLSLSQKIRLTWYLLTSKEPISKEEVEKCKQKDLLEQMLKEMTGEFPAMSEVFVQERDIYLANSLKISAQPIRHRDAPDGMPTVVVGVVGIGHVPGIVANWDKDTYNIKDIMIIPEGSAFGKVFKWCIRMSFVGILTLACYRLYKWTAPMIF